MASIRRTLSPVPRQGTLLNAEACSVASPLSKSSTCAQNYPASGGGLSSLLGFIDSHALFLGVSSPKSSRPLERSKPKAHVWRRALFHFFLCFTVGVFIGLITLAFQDFSMNSISKHQAFSFGVVSTAGKLHTHKGITIDGMSLVDNGDVMKDNTTEPQVKERELMSGVYEDISINVSSPQNTPIVFQKLLIIVTPTYARPFHAYYLHRLAYTLKRVQPPLLWIVVEMTTQSVETADILRRSGVMYRHLICKKNLTDMEDRSSHQRNTALNHIETHRLDGIVYFADDDNTYSVDLFQELRQIRRFGTWTVAKLNKKENKIVIEGPVCNGTKVIGWHTNEPSTPRFRRFHAEMSGFAFNSTILWDPKRWRRPTIEAIRQPGTVKEEYKASTLIEQVVEDESQMEGSLHNCSRIMVWNLPLESSTSLYPSKWASAHNLDVIIPLH